MKKKVTVTLDVNVARKALCVAGFSHQEIYNCTDEEIFAKVFEMIECYGATYEAKKPYSAASFDSFSHVCPFFTSKTPVNNGYGCLHTSQEEYEVGDDGVKRGKCYCWNCPLGISADDEAIDDPTVDWDGNEVEPGDVEDEYLLVRTDEEATEDEKKAWANYQRYINRYNH